MNPFRRAILAVLCCAALAAHAAEWSVRTWDTESGLPQNSVFAIAQTPDGYLWIGTLNGLARFDGLRFQIFNQANTPGLPENHIRTLFVDSRGTLWIGTEQGAIVMMSKGRVLAVPDIPVGPAERRLIAACEGSDGSVWLLNANKELWRYDGQHCSLFYLGEKESTEARALIRLQNGQVIVATDRKQSTIVTGAAGVADVHFTNEIMGRIDGLVASRRGGYWRMADLHVFWSDGREGGRDTGVYNWPLRAAAVSEDAEGNLIAGTEGAGLYWRRRDGSSEHLVIPPGDRAYNYILSLFVDREGTLWVGSDGGGLHRLQRKVFEVVPETKAWRVGSATHDRTNAIWFGARSIGLARLWQDKVDLVPGPPQASTVLVDPAQRVWAGTPERGLYQLSRGALAPVPNAAPGAYNAAFCDRASNVWFGTSSGLLRISPSGETRFYTTEDGLPGDGVTAIAEDQAGDLWVGTDRSGLARLHDNQFTSYRKADGAPGDDIAALLVDSRGILWVSTYGHGLGRLQNGRWTVYTKEHGLPGNSLSYLIENGDELWLGSLSGVLRLDKRELNEFAAGKRTRIRCRAYGKDDGLLTTECTGAQPGGFRDQDGRLWFSTIRGLAYVDPIRLISNTNPPPVVIEALVVDNKEIALTNELTLRPREERLEIEFAAVTLRAPERATFRYRMEGHETEWTEDVSSSVGRRVARYSKLPPGRYTFHVIASNEDGVWNEDGAQLGIIVQPPLWKTWWFITAMTLAAIGGIAGTVHLISTQRYQREVAALRQQEVLEKERARIARDIHDQVGASLTQVALLGELVESDKNSPADVEAHAQQISQTARETTRALDEIVWTVNPQNDTLEGLVNYICKYAQDYLGVAGIKYRLDVPPQMPAASIAPDVRHNVFLAAKEAVTNVVRHAKGDSAWVRVHLENATLAIEVEDNGRGLAGMDPQRAKTRHGLSNMRKRMEDVGGTFALEPGREGGARVRLTVPVKLAPEPPPTAS